ncbi:MAG: sarcosine oxidase subunit gamma [Actinomycetota bacterium]|uniref:sarcosine oxidase subunit gamma n=1 Tax=Paenarthrobacter sp. PH39-S1 TaxID=3046204 RepID=UPI0024BA5E57|nr:sarcosine oxidase subunit gamma family protein [Paenarthrobacter sp. PH39-S1]MDJ0354668.1 sarcosine oxidase subunit gamma family protein [Paenarthrobacter sp. PH39-S1]MDQ6740461.1 sarcosine oxidase subunit gamma [Actinomycetota bacterium]
MAETAEMANARLQGLRRSPAVHLWEKFEQESVAGSLGVTLREIPFLTMVGVRVDPASETGARIAEVVGGLPERCGEVGGPLAEGEATGTLWLGPEEFLVVGPAHGKGPDLLGRLLEALAGDAGQVVDLSANRTTFELAGHSALAVLEKSCALDLHPRAFTVGTALGTEIGSIPVVLWKLEAERFRIFPRASFADFVGRWLLDGMREFASVEVR